MVEEVGSGCSVRVDLPTQRCWALHDEIAAGSEQDGKIVDFQDIFLTRIISILIWLFRHNDWLGRAAPCGGNQTILIGKKFFRFVDGGVFSVL